MLARSLKVLRRHSRAAYLCQHKLYVYWRTQTAAREAFARMGLTMGGLPSLVTPRARVAHEEPFVWISDVGLHAKICDTYSVLDLNFRLALVLWSGARRAISC